MPEANLNVVLFAKSFNTDRTEIAPRSDIIRKGIQHDLRLIVHGEFLVAKFECREG